MVEGIYFSGRFGKGEYMEWYDNGQLALHCFFRNGEYHGEYSEWFDDGRLAMRLFYKNGKRIEPK
jgi:antitoxin component YwqK of YwqJK toxin-antitoxin module